MVDEASGEMTVGGVAAQLGLDASAGSRMVADCIQAGYLQRRASQRDGRRTELVLTAEGIALRDRFCSQQRQAFEYLTKDWPEAERLEFARLLLKYEAASDGPCSGRTYPFTDPEG